MKHKQRVEQVGFSTDGLLAWTAVDNDLTVWDTIAGEQVTPALTASGNLQSIANSPDGRRFVVATAEGTPRIWDLHPTLYSNEDLHSIARALSAHTLVQGTSSLRPLSQAEMHAAWGYARELLSAWEPVPNGK